LVFLATTGSRSPPSWRVGSWPRTLTGRPLRLCARTIKTRRVPRFLFVEPGSWGFLYVECGSPAPAFVPNTAPTSNHQRQLCCRHLNPGCQVPSLHQISGFLSLTTTHFLSVSHPRFVRVSLGFSSAASLHAFRERVREAATTYDRSCIRL
jgi:hypothetical protein